MSEARRLGDWVRTPNPADETQGTKMRGLGRAPSSWVPPMFAASPRLARDIMYEIPLSRAATRDAVALLRLVAGGERWVIVRSDGTEEAKRPGQAESFLVDASWPTVVDVMKRQMHVYGPEHRPMIQRFVNTSVCGVVSNERRLAAGRVLWTIEGWPQSGRPTTRRIRESVPREFGGALQATTLAGLRRCLGVVCGALASRNTQVRCEWAWDGTHLWVLQADEVRATRTDPDTEGRFTRRPWRDAAVTDVTAALGEHAFPKLQSQAEFAARGWRTVRTAHIEGASVAISRGSRRTEMVAGIVQDFGGALIVVRTDLSSTARPPTMLLPTSAPSAEPAALVAFMEEALGRLAADGIRDSDVAFLLSPLVNARASVMALGLPDSREIEMDALWGYPDGLLTLPHDQYRLRMGSPLRLRSHTAYKPACLMLSSTGRRYVELGAPWDWGPVLNREEIVTIGTWAHRLSRELGTPLQLMCLAQIGNRRGARGCLPFHYTRVEGPVPFDSSESGGSVSRVVDWGTLDRTIRLRPRPRGIELRPIEGLDRDPSFLRAVAQTAVQNQWVVRFHGSALGHAYYVLRSHGAIVAFGDPPADDRRLAVVDDCGARQVRGVPPPAVVGAPAFASVNPGAANSFARLPWLTASAAPELPDSRGEVPSFLRRWRAA